MPRPSYNWTRYWCPREGVLQFDEQGFLADPESEFGNIRNLDLLTAEELNAMRCLVLLGEPGIGKSHEIRHFQHILPAQGESNAQLLPVDLRAFSSDSLLNSTVFQCEAFNQWLNGTGVMYLLLDGLDECLLRIESIASFLGMKLAECPTDRLYLRIACRTAEWPHFLEEILQKLYSKDQIGVFELAPLCMRDVEIAANARSESSADAFVGELIARNTVPLAVKPVTLEMLLGLFGQNRTLPGTQGELYERGCLLLCEETDEQRRRYSRQQRPEAEVLMAAASRIAAITQFANRYAIWTDIDRGDIPPEDVKVAELSGGSEQVNGRRIELTEDVIRAAIETGLFTSRGPHRMGWAHQTYAEFLASHYVRRTAMSEQQVASLLFHPDDPANKLIPQLNETAAWIAGSNVATFSQIMESDPEVLLRSDVASMDDEYKRQLVDKLLALFDKARIFDHDTYHYYPKLKHPGLGQQLRPFIVDRTKGFLSRRVAVNVAETCKVTELVPALVSVALDESDDYGQRGEAACAVSRIGDIAARASLKPLVLGNGERDPDDTLKGWVLDALWPQLLTAEELFQSLTAPKNSHLIGSYASFLWRLPDLLAVSLQPEDFRFALAWVERNVGREHDFEKLQEWIMTRAWQHLADTPVLVEPYARAAVARIFHHESIAQGTKEEPFREVMVRNHQRRRRILAKALSFPQVMTQPLRIVWPSAIVTTDDFEWLFEQLAGRPASEQKAIVKLLIWLHDYSKAEQLEVLLRLRDEFPGLKDEFKRFEPVELESPTGRDMKAAYLKDERFRKRIESRGAPKPLLQPPPKDRVALLLEKFEHGDPNAWWHLNLEMTLNPDSEFYGDDFESDLRQLPVWAEVDPMMRARLVDVAEQFVLRPPTLDWSWIGTNQYNRPCLAGYRAMVLLFHEDRSSIEKLPGAVWETWAPAIVAYPFSSSQGREEPHLSLLALAYDRTPDTVLKTLGAVIDNECASMEHTYIARQFEHIWSDRIAASLLDKAHSPKLKPSCLADLMDILLNHHYQPGVQYAVSYVERAAQDGSLHNERPVAFAGVLWARCVSLAWDVLWPVFLTDPEFADMVFQHFAGHHWREGVRQSVDDLTEKQLGDLYLWFTERYPHREDPQWHGPIGVRHHLSEMRDAFLAELKSRGTTKACEQIRRIVAELPDRPWLRWVLQEAEKNTRMKTWHPPTPKEVINLAQDKQRRYVDHGGQLLDVLCESLRRFEIKLHDEIPSVEILWDNRGNTVSAQWCPVDETRLSNRLATHLRDDLGLSRGVVVNREVQIRPPMQRTDIHIDATRPDDTGEGSRTIRAIIEVKGSWNNELETAMQSQLVDRYLTQNQCPNGLYVVGWFTCDRWYPNDGRKSRAPSHSFEEARTHFEEQAAQIVNSRTIPGINLRSFILDARLSSS